MIYSCSSSDDTENLSDDSGGGNNPEFTLVLTNKQTAVIDETIMVELSGNEVIKTLEVSLDDFQSTIFNRTIDPHGFGRETELYFSFDEVGSKTISIKATNVNGNETKSTATVSISRGSAIKIAKIEVVSFSNIGNTWDPEFTNTDINRLADVVFLLRKAKADITENSLNFQDWFRSEIKENQGNLTWDLSTESLYADPMLSLRYSMADDDEGGVGQDLMLGPPFEREINLASYIATRPNAITLNVPEIDLEVIFSVEWN